MSDIYRNRQQIQVVKPKPKRRRRSSANRVFDDTSRRRRSSNSGLRRLLHLMRKDENESKVWWGGLIAALVLLAAVALWQFWYMERVARQRSREMERSIMRTQTAPAEEPATAKTADGTAGAAVP